MLLDTLRSSFARNSRGKTREQDPLAKTIVIDLLITTAGFLMAVIAIVLTVQGLSVS